MTDKQLLHEKIFKIFLSRGRVPEEAVINFWISELPLKFPMKLIFDVLDEMRWNGDDWPTLPKISNKIHENISDEFDLLTRDEKEKLYLEYYGKEHNGTYLTDEQWREKLFGTYKSNKLRKEMGDQIGYKEPHQIELS